MFLTGLSYQTRSAHGLAKWIAWRNSAGHRGYLDDSGLAVSDDPPAVISIWAPASATGPSSHAAAPLVVGD